MSLPSAPPAVQILCIDDDADVLAGLQLSLRQLGEVHVATGGEAAMALLPHLPQLAVVLCDMRMPGMTGDVVLAQCRQHCPGAARILLTGYSDIEAAMRAVNQGRIFRFLAKPCSRDELQQAVRDGIEQHRLIHAERELLEQTIKGCMQALIDALAMASPASFGQAQRMVDLVQLVSSRCRHEAGWAATMATMLANLGLVSLAPEVQEKVLFGLRLSQQEQNDVTRAQERTWQLLASVPRIEPVRQLLSRIEPALAGHQHEPSAPELAEQARLIRMVRRYVRLEAAGLPVLAALEQLEALPEATPELIAGLRDVLGPQADLSRQVQLVMALLRPGMVLMQPVHTRGGQLLAPAGYQINDSFVERLLAACPELRHERLSVLIPSGLSGLPHPQLLT
ncbi:MAG: response regulator [Pseudomonadota bacterium]